MSSAIQYFHSKRGQFSQLLKPAHLATICISYHVFVSAKHSSFESQKSTFFRQTCRDKQSTYTTSFAPERNQFTGHTVLKFLLCHPPMAVQNTKKLFSLRVHQFTKSSPFKIRVQQVRIWNAALCCRTDTRTTHARTHTHTDNYSELERELIFTQWKFHQRDYIV